MPTADLEMNPSPEAPPVAFRRLMAGAAVCMIMFGGVLVVPAVSLDSLGTELGLNFEQRGLLMTVRTGAMLVSLLLAGYLARGSNRRHFLLWGLVGIGAAQALAGRAVGYTSLMGAMVVSGLGKGVVEALVNPVVAQLNPAQSGRALNIVNGLFSVGLVVGSIATGELLQAGFSWRMSFWVWVVPPLVCAVLFFTPHYPSRPSSSGGLSMRVEALRRFLALPLFWVLFLAMVMGGGCEAGLTAWAPNYAADVLDASARGGAWTTILYGAFMAVGRFGSGLLLARITPVNLMLASAVACGVVTLGLIFVPVLWGAWALFALGGLFVACFWPTLLAVASDHISAGSTSLFALLAAAGIVGCVVVPWAIGALADLFGLRLAMLLLPGTMGALVSLLVVIPRLTAASAREGPG